MKNFGLMFLVAAASAAGSYLLTDISYLWIAAPVIAAVATQLSFRTLQLLATASASFICAVAAVALCSAAFEPPVLQVIRPLIFTLTLVSCAWVIDRVSCTSEERSTPRLFADSSALADTRLATLAASGLLDGRLAIPSFVIESASESALEHLDQLKKIPELKLELHSCEFSGASEEEKMQALLRSNEGRWLTASAGSSKVDNEPLLIPLDALARQLQPERSEGEFLEIKIQRPGKEEGQGVGYLDDGSMVVVNGAGGNVGEVVAGAVLSTKYTQAGRIIFCNYVGEDQLA